MKTKKRKATVTVKDVARESGLSLSTVIHILGGREQRYREETCRKVHETAQKMGYRRNSSARAMRSGKFDCVALLMSAEPDATLIRQEALEGICDELAAHGMHLNVARLPGQALADEGLVPKLLREWTADGLLVAFAMQIPPTMAERIESSNLPCVWMRSKRDFDCVYLDEMGAARQAVDHLAKLGHRRIAFADYTYGTQSLSASHHGLLDFEAGYRERMTEAGLAPQVIREEDRVERSERAARFRAIFSRKDRPTALIAMPSTALPAVTAAVSAGLRIPEDISIVTMADQLQDSTGIALTTLITPEYDIGRQSAALVVQRIKEPGKPLPPRIVKFALAEAGSCAPPPKRERSTTATRN